MNKRFLMTRLTNAQAIIILVAANLIATGYLISLENFIHDSILRSQDALLNLVHSQGNLSSTQRQKIINEFENIPEGGIAGQKLLQEHVNDIMINQHLLKEILGNLTHKNLVG